MTTANLTKINHSQLLFTETKLEWLKTLRQPAFTLPALLFPLMFYLFFGILFAKTTEHSAYMLVTYGVFGIIGPALFSFGVGVAVERGQGWFALKQASPAPAWSMIIARTLVSLAFAVVIISVLFIMAATLGKVTMSAQHWLSLFAILLAGAVPFCLMGLLFGLFLPSNSAAAIVNLIYLPMAFLSGLWMPIFLLPELMQTLANVLPPYHLSQLGLAATGMQHQSSVWVHAGYLVAFTLMMFAITVVVYNKRRN